jgi:hypothetical protein
MSFIGDTTNLDEAFTRIVAQADTSMSEAAGSVGKFTGALSGIEPVIANSKSDVDSWNQEVMRAMGEAGQGVKIFSSEAVNGGDKMQYSFREARGGIMLLTEEIGVHLPRELTMLLAHIMPVGIAFEAMLPILGVVAAIKVIGDLIEKHEKLAEAQRHHQETTESLVIKQNDLVLALKAANLQIEDQILKLEGRPEQNKLAIALIQVKDAADNLASSFAADFSKMDSELEKQNGLWANLKNSALAALAAATPELVALKWQKSAQDQIAANYLVQDSVKQVIAAEEKLNEARRKLADIDPTKNMEAWKAAAGAVAIAAGNVQSVADAAHTAVKTVEPDAHDLLAALTDKAILASAEWKAMGEEINKSGLEIRKVNQELANDAASRGAADAKRGLDAQLADIETWKTAQHAAYESRKTDLALWLAAEMHATDAAAIAHEDYLRKLVAIYAKAGDTQKLQVARQELATMETKNAAEATDKLATAQDKHRIATQKVVEEYAKLVNAGIEKDFAATTKATEALTKAEEELSKAQAKLSEDKISQHFRDQEDAITRLAAMHLITEQQKNDRLRLLEQQQADAALKILDDELKKEEKLRDAAQAKLAAAKANPSSTSSQLVELEVELTKEVAAVTRAEDAKLQAEERFNKQSEQNDKSHYGRALLLAMSYGKELLAEELKQNHAELLATQQELALAKARGQDTTAIQLKIVALKQHEQQLEKEANGNKQLLAQQLQLTNAQLLASQAVLADAKARGLDTTAIEKEIATLKQLQTELQKTTQDTHSLAQAEADLKNEGNALASEMQSAFVTAFEAIVKGTESFGQAMKQMIGQMAESLGKYFAARGIADIFFNPALGAAELAAAAALFALSGALGGGGSSGSGSNPNQGSGLIAGQTGSSGGGSNQTVSVTHLAEGGLVTGPTRALIGEKGAEAVIPLTNPDAMARLANALLSPSSLRIASAHSSDPAAIAAASNARQGGFDDAAMGKLGDIIGTHLDSSGSAGDVTHNHINIKGSVDHGTIAGLVRKINQGVGNRRLNLNASNSLRVTRRSQ